MIRSGDLVRRVSESWADDYQLLAADDALLIDYGADGGAGYARTHPKSKSGGINRRVIASASRRAA
ncbi:MAG TPA: hypothetical protein VLW53_22875 [Candidatus Eisenbacteria bacterium]|nr:hypothetical protein [Candidatus Eisenbacteria bacterium]